MLLSSLVLSGWRVGSNLLLDLLGSLGSIFGRIVGEKNSSDSFFVLLSGWIVVLGSSVSTCTVLEGNRPGRELGLAIFSSYPVFNPFFSFLNKTILLLLRFPERNDLFYSERMYLDMSIINVLYCWKIEIKCFGSLYVFICRCNGSSCLFNDK